MFVSTANLQGEQVAVVFHTHTGEIIYVFLHKVLNTYICRHNKLQIFI